MKKWRWLLIVVILCLLQQEVNSQNKNKNKKRNLGNKQKGTGKNSSKNKKTKKQPKKRLFCPKFSPNLIQKYNWDTVSYWDIKGVKPKKIKTKTIKKGGVVRIKCGGASGENLIYPSSLYCKCLKGRCGWHYPKESGLKFYFRDGPPSCVKASCLKRDTPNISEGNKGQLNCDRELTGGGILYPFNTRCDVQCNKDFNLSSGADFSVCDCNMKNNTKTRVTPISSDCKWKNMMYKNKKEQTYPRVTDRLFECKSAACDPPINPNQGKTICDEVMDEGSKCRYQCNNKYILEKEVEATCKCKIIDRLSVCKYEEPFAPKCVLDHSILPTCPILPMHPRNGYLECLNRKTTVQGVEKNTAGTICHFKCNSGFEANHNSDAICMCNGSDCKWRMLQEPTKCVAVDVCKKESQSGLNPCYNTEEDNEGVEHTCQSNSDGTYGFGWVLRLYICECASNFLYSQSLKSCIKARCPEFYERLKFLPNSAKNFLPDPVCVNQEDKKDKRNKKWVAIPGKFDYFKGTVCYPRCEPGYVVTGKMNYQCVCRGNDPLDCDWSDGMYLQKNGVMRTECEFSETSSIIKKELEELLGGSLGGEMSPLPLENINRGVNDVDIVDFELPNEAYYTKSNQDKDQKLIEYKPKTGYKEDGIKAPRKTKKLERYDKNFSKRKEDKENSDLRSNEYVEYDLSQAFGDINFDEALSVDSILDEDEDLSDFEDEKNEPQTQIHVQEDGKKSNEDITTLWQKFADAFF